MQNRKHHVRGGLPQMYVIDEGIFRGFIPINHHWVQDDPGMYYDISNSVKQPRKVHMIDKKAFSAFDFQGYQVVRSQFLQFRYEGPTITISKDRIVFNRFCIRKFRDVAYIQLLLHPTERRIAIRPCEKGDAHYIRWMSKPDKTVFMKAISCSHFGNALYSIMEWNPDFVYKIRGTWARRGVEQIIVFNLPNAVPTMLAPTDGDSVGRKRRINLCPEEWADDFGAEFYEHTLDNGFYYIAPKSEWNSQSKGVLAPGVDQFASTTPEQLERFIDILKKGVAVKDGQE